MANRVETASQQPDDVDHSLFDDYKEISYRLFQLRDYNVRGSNGLFKCPFCACEEEADQDYTHLLQHAIAVAEGDSSRKQRAKHLAMAKYVAVDLSIEGKACDIACDMCQKNLVQGTSAQKRSKPSFDSAKSEFEVCARILRLESRIDEMNALITKVRPTNEKILRLESRINEMNALITKDQPTNEKTFQFCPWLPNASRHL